ncbi:MAG: cell surface protein SprA [Saprospiraceae bacterium]|nr:cell surface protein SprA [Saprospiraceae bacterium]
MTLKERFLVCFLVSGCIFQAFSGTPSRNLPDPYNQEVIKTNSLDTIPLVDRKGDFITDKKYNPFDITPKEITQKVEYDPVTGQYIVLEKIGEEYYRTPTYLTFDEYMDYVAKDQERRYFNTLGGIKSEKKSKSGKIDPIDRIDLQNSLIDRLFGGTEINIQPQGRVDLNVGWIYTKRNDPRLTLNAQRVSQPDFTTQIKMGVNGKIGKKLDLDFNYDTQSTFDFDRKTKLAFDSDAFSEDDIIKKIEAGNVSLPLRGNLIEGAQSLFGLKAEVQFGRLRLTGLLSQQKSKNNSIRIENGVSEQQFTLTPNKYDADRHFFISHYNRDVYERALSTIPYIRTPHQIVQVEVWVSDDRPEFQENSSMIAAIADLAEPQKAHSTNPNSATVYAGGDRDDFGELLPDNKVNDIYEKLQSSKNIVDIDKVTNILEGPEFLLKRTKDFEVFRGRRLSPSEYTYNPKLGTVSLNVRLRPNQVLGVAYNYYYTSNPNAVYQIGQLSLNSINPANQADTTRVEPPKVHFVKLLKSTNQIVNTPMWELMMKNVYNLNTSSLNPSDFEFDVYYEDDYTDGSLKRYMPDPVLIKVPILELFNLDNLNRFGDPQPDGYFDYIPDVTVIERTGSIVFPVLEPFGGHLTGERVGKMMIDKYNLDTLGLESALAKFRYRELYEQIQAVTEHTGLTQNKFRMVGKVKSGSSNGEFSLGFYIPQGSVRVSAGGKQLTEGLDYEIDYSLGKLRIINPAYLSQGTPIDVRFEDNSLFSLQQKSMKGIRAEYQFSKKISLGATYLKLSEKPITEKVNIGDDPIKNRMFGMDFNYSEEVPFITKLVDKLPFYSTSEKSRLNFTAEVAGFKPGHAKGIDLKYEDYKGNIIYENEGIANLDDFEGAVSGFNLGGYNANLWTLASTPSELSVDATKFKESSLVNNLAYNANRALLNWSTLDLGTNRSSIDNQNPYTQIINQNQLFTNRQVQPGQQQQLFTFDISYYPTDRGPYNFDNRDGYPGYTKGFDVINDKIVLRGPATRWAGIQRYFQNSDFESANYESIEFWMLNPFMDRGDGYPAISGESGKIVFNLGSVSEDVVKDNLLFFENALPTSQRRVPVLNTPFGRATVSIPLVNGFDLQEGPAQDLGLDGLDNQQEAIRFESWLVENGLANISEIASDPANDDFKFFNDPSLNQYPSLLDRMKKFNGPQGNTPFNNSNSLTASTSVRGNNNPDTEDINNNKSLDQTEAFYEYVLDIKRLDNSNELDTSLVGRYLRETKVIKVGGKEQKWYRFQVPLSSGNKVGEINGFRGIQFMRMYFTDFESPKTFRLAEFQLQRSIWRKQLPICEVVRDGIDKLEFSIDDVGIEENSDKLPFNYRTRKGAIRTKSFGQLAQIFQDERSMALKFRNVPQTCEVGMTKIANVNLALYKRLQMFVHAENLLNVIGDSINDGDISVIVRLGKDFPVDSSSLYTTERRKMTNNYYEYELPLTISKSDPGHKNQEEANIWPDKNYINIPLDSLLQLRKTRIANGINARDTIIQAVINPEKGDVIRMVGNPSLGTVKVIEISVKNRSTRKIVSGEIWVNEMRVTGYNEKFAWAAQSRLQLQMADLGEINLAGEYSSTGFGRLDNRLHERRREEKLQYDAAINIDAGKLLPKEIQMVVPVYAQYQKTIVTPEFDPIDQDIRVKDKLDLIENRHDRDSIQSLARTEVTIKTFTITNAKITAGGTGKPWSPSNFGISYAYTENSLSDFLLKEDKQQSRALGLEYVFTRKTSYIEPLKFIKVKALKILSDFNFSILPNNFSFTSKMTDQLNRRTFRQPLVPIYAFDDNRFNWERNYVLDWDLTKSLRFGYRAQTNAIVDQLRYVGVANTLEDRQLVDERGSLRDENGRLYRDIVNETDDPNYYRNRNLRSLGRSKSYMHNVSLNYKLPFKSIPILDWINAGADYRADYGWDAGSLITIDDAGTLLGNTIRNGQNASLNVSFDFSKLYNKSGYLKSIETGKASKSTKVQTPAQRQRNVSSRDKKDKDNMDMAEPEKEMDSLDITKESNKDQKTKEAKSKEDKPRVPSVIERVLLRPLMLVRSVKFNYKDDRSTQIPGFMPQSKLLGQSDGFTAPGWDFIAGFQPNLEGQNNWLLRNQEWFNPSKKFNEGLIQTKRHSIDVKTLIEPFKDFSIDISLKKNYQQTHNEVFRKTEKTGDDFQQLALYDVGSYDASFYALNTLFKDSRGLYELFKSNREIIARRLPNIDNPGVYEQDPHYPGGYGPTNINVTVPAFIATYTDQSPYDVELDQVAVYSKNTFIPLPNWQLNYAGLSKIPSIRKHFSNITIKHGYASTIRVSSFQTSPLYDINDPFGELSPNSNYFSRLEVPAVIIQEQFVPVLGISLKTIKDLKMDFDFKMSRNLTIDVAQLRETKAKEISVGAGYVLKNFKAFKKNKKSSKKKKNQEDDDANKKSGGIFGNLIKDKGTSAQGKDLKINLTYSLKDDISEVYDLQTGVDGQSNRGQKTVTFSPNVEYDVNKNLALRFFFDYSKTLPRTTLSFPTTTIRSGVTLRFSIN